GEYAIAIRFFGSPRGTIDIRLDNARIAVLDAAAPKVSAAPGMPEPPREVRFAAQAGLRLVGITSAQRATLSESLVADPDGLPVRSRGLFQTCVASVELIGPYNA